MMRINEIIIAATLFILLAISFLNAGVIPLGGNRFVTEESILESPVEPGSSIHISSAFNLSGKVNIIAQDIDQVVFEYKKVLKALSQSKATEYADLIEVNFQKVSDGLKILLQSPNPAPWAGTNDAGLIEGRLLLPENCDIVVDAIYFDLAMEGPFRSVENRSSFGRLDIQKVTERLNLSGSNRDMNIEDISGDIYISTSNADIRIEDIITGSRAARIRNENGDIFIDKAKGTLNIKSSYGRIRLNDVSLFDGASRIIGVHCPIKMEVIEISDAELSISSTYEDVMLFLAETVSARISLEVESEGEMHVNDITVKPILIESNRLELVVGDGNSEIIVDVEGGGNINIEGIPASGK